MLFKKSGRQSLIGAAKQTLSFAAMVGRIPVAPWGDSQQAQFSLPMAKTQSGYGSLARYYDLMHQEVTDDLPLIVSLGLEAGGRVLELGCGTGRVLLPLANAGINVVGVDNSPQMLARAETQLAAQPAPMQARIRLLQGDMIDLPAVDLPGPFALVIVAYNTLTHFDQTALVSLVTGARRLMGQGALFFADLPNPFLLEQWQPVDDFEEEVTVHDPVVARQIVISSLTKIDRSRQAMTITWRFDDWDSERDKLHRSQVEVIYRYYYPHQIEILLRSAGLKLVSLWGEYNRASFTPESERLIFLATEED